MGCVGRGFLLVSRLLFLFLFARLFCPPPVIAFDSPSLSYALYFFYLFWAAVWERKIGMPHGKKVCCHIMFTAFACEGEKKWGEFTPSSGCCLFLLARYLLGLS